jgi:tetratricopeptide (TPR) repeat protein
MKRTISLWLGILAFALLPALAQTPAAPTAPKGPTGKIHGHVNGPEGASKNGGTVSLSNDGGHTSKFDFQVSSTGDYTGEATPGTYTVVYRDKTMKSTEFADKFDGVKILVGQDILQDFDMSRKAYIDSLTPDEKKQLEALKKKNSEILKEDAVVRGINADIRQAVQDLNDAEAAHAAAVQALGATASRDDLAAKEIEIKTAKYTEVETLMLRDSAAKPDASVLWKDLGKAQVGLGKVGDPKKYDDAEKNLKKALEVEAASKKPSLSIQGETNASLGEVYARTGKVPEANAAYDASAKADPTRASIYLTNEATIFVNAANGDAAAAAADEAIKADPTKPLPYYLKGQALIQKATLDPKTGKMILPPGCEEAYQKYLALDPTVFGTVNPSKKKKGN